MKTIRSFIPAATVCTLSLSLFASPIQAAAPEELTSYKKGATGLTAELVGRYSSGAAIDEGGTEIVVYDPNSYRAFSVNGAEKALDILDLSVLQEANTMDIPLLKRIPLSDLGVEASDVTSVAIHPDGEFIAVSAPALKKEQPGSVVFLTIDGKQLGHVKVGALPDMLTFTPDGNQLLVANEGEPTEDYTVNPPGSVSMIDVSQPIEDLDDKAVTTVPFEEQVIANDVRKVHPESSYAEDLEPEYITIDAAGEYAYVVLQENNAMAKLDIQKQQVVSVTSLGYKDYSIPKNQLDPSNKDDEAAIENWPVLAMYQPDGLTSFEVDGQTYLLSANEGDAQDWEGFSEEARVADLAKDYQLNAELYKGYNQNQLDKLVKNGLFEEDQLGRLNTSVSQPKNEDGKYEAIYGFGGRSFSVWNADTMGLAYDSADDFEQITAKVYPDYFNSSNDEDGFDSRSDDKGPEPESVITGEIGGTDYAFIGLERQGGIMVYDLSKPTAPKFDSYFSSRVFTGPEAEVTGQSGDVAPEGLAFIPEDESPSGQNLLLAAHEVSGTIAVYAIDEKKQGNKPDHANVQKSSKALHFFTAILAVPDKLSAFFSK